MERRTTKIKKTDLDGMTIPYGSNDVIIKITERSKDKRTKGGIYVGYNEDAVYAEGEESHAADVAEVWGEVFRRPKKLFYSKGDSDSMPWDTDIEIQEGDAVWFDYYESVNCDVLECGDDVFYVIPYRDLYVVRRGDKIIPLNGYCLCEPIEVTHDSELAINIGAKYRTDKAIVRHRGTPNKRYQPTDAIVGTYNNDDIGVSEGDTVLLRHNFTPYFLERLESIATFSEQPYYVIQRRHMQIVL